MRPGQRGYMLDSGSTGDQTSGGSGGISQMLAYIPGVSGPVSMSDGNSAVVLLQLTGSGGGADSDYINANSNGAEYSTITTITNTYSTIYSAGGQTYSRSGTAYGGFPSGTATDDGAANSNLNQNYYNSTYCSVVTSATVDGSYSSATNAQVGKFVFLSGAIN